MAKFLLKIVPSIKINHAMRRKWKQILKYQLLVFSVILLLFSHSINAVESDSANKELTPVNSVLTENSDSPPQASVANSNLSEPNSETSVSKPVEDLPPNTLSEKRPGRIGFSDFLATFVSLIVILLIIIGIAWLIKRSGFIIGGDNHLIRLLASIQVGQKERIALIQVGNEQILIGIAAGNVQKLHVMKEPVTAEKSGSEDSSGNLFELVLKKYQRNNKVEQ